MSRVVHFEILAENPEELTEFYKQALGWSVEAFDGPQQYWLATTGPEGTPGINGGIMARHFSQPVINTIQIESLDETLGKIEQAGGRLAHGPHEIPGIGLHAYCEDPQGNLFGLLQPGLPGPPPQAD